MRKYAFLFFLTLITLTLTRSSFGQESEPDVKANDEGAILSEKRQHTFPKWIGDRALKGSKRSSLAFTNKETEVNDLFSNKGLRFPPKAMLWRVFKEEEELEVWASNSASGELSLVATYGICAMSGDLGPKRTEGDFQVPEGFYFIDDFYDRSDYYLSMRVNYPNRSDTELGTRPFGNSIMIHGDCASIGCIAMSDERIQELWVMAKRVTRDTQVVNVHIFPGRDMEKYIAKSVSDHDKVLETFWTNIKEGYDHFERLHKLPTVSVNRRTGAYVFR